MIWIANCINTFLLQNLLICLRKQTEIVCYLSRCGESVWILSKTGQMRGFMDWYSAVGSQKMSVSDVYNFKHDFL